MIDALAFGNENAAPTTALLEEILARAARIEIIETSPDELDRTDTARIAVSGPDIGDLAQRLAIVDGGTGDHCRCLGWPTILVYNAKDDQIAQWTLHHQTGIRGLGSCDAELRDAPGLTEWLAERGLTGSHEMQLFLARQRAKDEQRRAAWVLVAPPGLAAAAESASQREDGAEARLAELVKQQYPDTNERVRTLLSWAGFPARHDDGTPWYELAPQRILLGESTESIYEALTWTPPTPAQLDGAAELFTSFEWTGSSRAEIPEWLKLQLIAHVKASGTEPMRLRMHHGYGKGLSDSTGTA